MSDERTRASYNSGKSLRILVVEDHSDTLQALSRLLSHFGHEICLADTAQNALNMLESKEFDVVLCDIALPDGNGYDVIAQAKRRRSVKAVALTVARKPVSISTLQNRWTFTNYALSWARSQSEESTNQPGAALPTTERIVGQARRLPEC